MPVNRRDFLSASAGLALAPVLGGRALAAPLPREAD
ncbi:twin-arginine translocation signal domain-containing protein, partial [Bradyrhizobium sp.]